MENDNNFSKFDRRFFDATDDFTIIGNGSIGGKAKGLAFIKKHLLENPDLQELKDIKVNIPRLTVISTDFFDEFMQTNILYEIALSDASDSIIANKFQKGELSINLIGDLRGLISHVSSPLAIRSSSMLEDAMYEPFAGIYTTKMIPNNQLNEDTRFKRLIEAIKFVYASTFFTKAKDYINAVGKNSKDEKMAVIIQEVVGSRYGNRYYPEISGVARSYNYYSFGKSKPEDGVVNLALGLGKTIVDGGISWTYTPAFSNISPPYGSLKALMDNTQRDFWAVNMEKPYMYDPVNESEYLIKSDINDAEEDGTLNYVCSTYDVSSERVKPGTGHSGPRILNFNPILDLNLISLNNLLKKLMKVSEDAIGAPVEIEFAMTLKKDGKLSPRFGFLQVRPMVVTNDEVMIEEKEFADALFSSNYVLGNGTVDYIEDVVYVKPETFDVSNTEIIAGEIETLNRKLKDENKKYLLVGFGRWGSTDKWLGIPVEWGQISNAKVIVEAMLPQFDVELSQGSHFFHNINSFQVLYFSVKSDKVDSIDWKRLSESETVSELNFTKHVHLNKPLMIKVDGRIAKGVILK